MSDVNDFVDPMEYFYVSYLGEPGIAGCICISQHRKDGFEINPDGFNVAAAHRHLFGLLQRPIIILYWQKITKKRRDEMGEFLEGVRKNSDGKHTPHLQLVKRPPEESI